MHSDGAETSKRSHWERLPIAVALEPVWSSTEHDGRKAGLTDTLGDKLQFGDDQERITGHPETGHSPSALPRSESSEIVALRVA
jgi:hypothetical protein